MGFLGGLVFGFAVGLTTVVGLLFAMQCRSRRRVRKVSGIHLLSSLRQDELRKLCGTSYPNWISFPTFERVKWLNQNLEKVWPFATEAAQDLIKYYVEPMLEQYRPVGIQSLKFDKLRLGTVAPKIDGVRVQSLREGQVILDMEFRWGGNPSIILGVHPLVGPRLPVQLKDLSFFGTIRVIFQLTDDITCISAIVVALLPTPLPRIKYTLKVIGGSTNVIPGLSDMIDDMVESLVADQLQWPHRLVIPIGNVSPDVVSNLELKLQGRLTVTIVRATHLKNMEMIGKSDPYVILYVRVLFKEKTRVHDNNLNPEFNETFELNVEDQETQTLILLVKDEDQLGQDKTLGVAAIALAGLKHDESTEIVKSLSPSLDTDRVKDKKNRGSITVKLKYHPFTKEEQVASMESEKKFLDAKAKASDLGLIGGTMDALGGAVGGGVKLVGSGIGMVGTGLGAGVGAVGSGVGMVGSGIGRAGKLMSKGVSRHFGNSNKLNGNPIHENGSTR